MSKSPSQLEIDLPFLTPFWIIFLKDPVTHSIHGVAYDHNATGDYKGNPYYICTEEIEIDTSRWKV